MPTPGVLLPLDKEGSVSRDGMRVQPPRVPPPRAAKLRAAAKLRRAAKVSRAAKLDSLGDVPADLRSRITRELATANDSLEAVCKSVISWCHTANAANCRLDDAMFRSLLVVFGLPREWLNMTFPNGRDVVPVVPGDPAPFSSWWILWITLCKAFNGTTFWLQHGDDGDTIDAHWDERRRLRNEHGPRDPFQIRDVLLDPASGVRVRAYAHAVLNRWTTWYPEPQDGIYRVPPASSASASARSSRADHDIRMQNVAMHWLMKPAATFAEYTFLKRPEFSLNPQPWNMDELWYSADRALSELLLDDGWLLDGRLQDGMTFGGGFPILAGYVPYTEYMSDPVQLADYLINKLDAGAVGTDGLNAAARRFDAEMQHGRPTEDIEGTALMRVFDMVIDAEIRGRRIWALLKGFYDDFHSWMTVLQRINVALLSCVPESFPGAGDAYAPFELSYGRPSKRPLDEQIASDIRIFVEACPDRTHLSDITFDSIQNKLARKYSGDDDPSGAAAAAAANAIRFNKDRIESVLHPLSKQKALQYWPADDEDTLQALDGVVDALRQSPQPWFVIKREVVERQALQKAPTALGIPPEMFPDELGTTVKAMIGELFEKYESLAAARSRVSDFEFPADFPGPSAPK